MAGTAAHDFCSPPPCPRLGNRPQVRSPTETQIQPQHRAAAGKCEPVLLTCEDRCVDADELPGAGQQRPATIPCGARQSARTGGAAGRGARGCQSGRTVGAAMRGRLLLGAAAPQGGRFACLGRAATAGLRPDPPGSPPPTHPTHKEMSLAGGRRAPGLMAASVCMPPGMMLPVTARMSRFSALTMPGRRQARERGGVCGPGPSGYHFMGAGGWGLTLLRRLAGAVRLAAGSGCRGWSPRVVAPAGRRPRTQRERVVKRAKGVADGQHLLPNAHGRRVALGHRPQQLGWGGDLRAPGGGRSRVGGHPGGWGTAGAAALLAAPANSKAATGGVLLVAGAARLVAGWPLRQAALPGAP